MAGEIVVGYEGPASDAALETATRIAAAFRAALVIVFGYQPPLAGGEVGDLRKAIKEVAEKATTAAVAAAHAIDPEVSVVVELVDDKPAESLLRVADAYDALAIVVGSAGRGPVAGSLLGSVTYQIVHRSTRPVVVVPGPADPED